MTIKDIKDKTPNQSAIELLEMMLDHAKKGEVRSVFLICGYDEDSVSHSWVLDKRNNKRMMLAEMVMAQHNFTVNIEFAEKDSILAQAVE